MKNLFCIPLLVLILINPASSQTLHTIIFTNTKDNTICASAAKNTGHIRSITQAVAEKAGLLLHEQVFDGDQYNFDNLKSIMTSLEVKKEDAVFFYFNSHGFKSNSESNFPRIVIETNSSARFLFSSDKINEALKIKCNGCALNITVIQACNKITRSTNHDLEVDTRPLLTDFSEENFTNLFRSRQNILVISSRRGKTSIALPSKGSVFTMAFAKALIETARNEQPAEVSWKKILHVSKKITLSREGHRNRFPVWSMQPL